MILGKYSLGGVELKCTHWVHFSSTPPKLSLNWETENLPIYRIWCFWLLVWGCVRFLHIDGSLSILRSSRDFAVVISCELVHVVEEHLSLEDADVAPDVQVGGPVSALLRFCRQDARDVLLA